MKRIFLFLLLATVARGATYDYPVKTATNALSASKALTTDANGKAAASATTSTEIGYVSGVTSAIQTQLNAKGAATNGTFSGGTFTGTTNTGGIFTGSLTGTNAILTTPRLTGTTTNTLGNFQVANTFGLFGVSTGGVAESLITITSANGVGISAPTESGAIFLQPRHASGAVSLVNSAGLTGLSMAGSSVITVSSNLIANAKLGIGVTPTYLLHVYGSGGVQQLLHSTTTTGPIIQFNGQRTDNAGFMVIGQLASYPSASYQSGDNSMRMLVTTANEGGLTTAQTWKSDGKTGLGTTSPQYTLDLIGQARISGTNGMRFGGTSGATDDTVTLFQSAANVLTVNATTRVEMPGNLNVGFTGSGVSTFNVKSASSRPAVIQSTVALTSDAIAYRDQYGYYLSGVDSLAYVFQPTGVSTNRNRMVGTVKTDTTSVANTSTSETNLMTYTFPAGGLAATGDSVVMEGFGTTAANGNTKTVRVYFGATKLGDSGNITASGVAWRVNARIVRTGAATQIAICTISVDGMTPVTTHTTPAETLGGTVVAKVTGQSATASSDVTQTFQSIEFKPAN